MTIRKLNDAEIKVVQGGIAAHLIGYAPMERRLERVQIMNSGFGGGSGSQTVVDLRR